MSLTNIFSCKIRIDSEQILKQIKKSARQKIGFDLTVSGKATKLDTNFSPEIVLDGNWGIALQNI